MNSLTIHPADNNQDTAIRLFLDALHVSYDTITDSNDETEYLSASASMKARLDEAKKQEENKEGIKISLDDIWK